MSDYLSSKASNRTHRGDGVGGLGLVYALLVLLGVIALLAIAGAIGGAGDATAPGADLITPAAEAPALPTE